MEILGPGAEAKGQGERGRGRESEGSFPHRPLIHTVPSVSNPTVAACGGDGLRGRARRFLKA